MRTYRLVSYCVWLRYLFPFWREKVAQQGLKDGVENTIASERKRERMYHENGKSYINTNFTYSSLVNIRVMKPSRLRWKKK